VYEWIFSVNEREFKGYIAYERHLPEMTLGLLNTNWQLVVVGMEKDKDGLAPMWEKIRTYICEGEKNMK